MTTTTELLAKIKAAAESSKANFDDDQVIVSTSAILQLVEAFQGMKKALEFYSGIDESMAIACEGKLKIYDPLGYQARQALAALDSEGGV